MLHRSHKTKLVGGRDEEYESEQQQPHGHHSRGGMPSRSSGGTLWLFFLGLCFLAVVLLLANMWLRVAAAGADSGNVSLGKHVTHMEKDPKLPAAVVRAVESVEPSVVRPMHHLPDEDGSTGTHTQLPSSSPLHQHDAQAGSRPPGIATPFCGEIESALSKHDNRAVSQRAHSFFSGLKVPFDGQKGESMRIQHTGGKGKKDKDDKGEAAEGKTRWALFDGHSSMAFPRRSGGSALSGGKTDLIGTPLDAGFHCLASYDERDSKNSKHTGTGTSNGKKKKETEESSPKCISGVVALVLTDPDRKGSEYAVPSSFIARHYFDSTIKVHQRSNTTHQHKNNNKKKNPTSTGTGSVGGDFVERLLKSPDNSKKSPLSTCKVPSGQDLRWMLPPKEVIQRFGATPKGKGTDSRRYAGQVPLIGVVWMENQYEGGKDRTSHHRDDAHDCFYARKSILLSIDEGDAASKRKNHDDEPHSLLTAATSTGVVELYGGKGSFWIVPDESHSPSLSGAHRGKWTQTLASGGQQHYDPGSRVRQVPAGTVLSLHEEADRVSAVDGDVAAGGRVNEEEEEESGFVEVSTGAQLVDALHENKRFLHITDTLSLAHEDIEGKTAAVVVPKGAVLLFDSNTALTVKAGVTLTFNGTIEECISVTVFSSAQHKKEKGKGIPAAGGTPYWGGIVVEAGATVEATGTVFSFAGSLTLKRPKGTGTHIKDANPVFTFAPSSSGGAVSRGTFAHVALVNSKGPGVGAGDGAVIRLKHTLFQDLAQGGECVGCDIRLTSSHVLDIPYVRSTIQRLDRQEEGEDQAARGGEEREPNGEYAGEKMPSSSSSSSSSPVMARETPKVFVDKDNDGFYFRGGTAEVMDTVIAHTLDDGIDSASSKPHTMSGMVPNAHAGKRQQFSSLSVSGSWIGFCQHEGIALSASQGTYRVVEIEHSTISHCQQGIEVGYCPETHFANISFCTMVKNDIGVRYGDNYPKTVAGLANIEDSTFVGNRIAVLNYVKHREQKWRKHMADPHHRGTRGTSGLPGVLLMRREEPRWSREQRPTRQFAALFAEAAEKKATKLQHSGHEDTAPLTVQYSWFDGGNTATADSKSEQIPLSLKVFDAKGGYLCGVQHFLSIGNRPIGFGSGEES